MTVPLLDGVAERLAKNYVEKWINHIPRRSGKLRRHPLKEAETSYNFAVLNLLLSMVALILGGFQGILPLISLESLFLAIFLFRYHDKLVTIEGNAMTCLNLGK